jgi:alpha-beta hydrolase superfamily lysophospholipase
MGRLLRAWLRRVVVVFAAVLVLFLGIRIIEVERGPPLRPWHTMVPDEMRVAAIDAADWAHYVAAEAALFDATGRALEASLEAADRVPANRFNPASLLNPRHFAQDWNRSFVLQPQGEVAGVAVFLHGLTDAPYSLRHIALQYQQRGFIALGLRLPGHGTVPGALTEVTAEDWQAATRLAMREARARAGATRPVHLVGYSNGGALAMKYALDALENPSLPQAERLVLISPMVGVTGFARFAGLAALPALLPAFAKAAWLDILPEFNPFKYNSFPVNAARQSFRVSSALQQQVERLARAGRLAALPPVLTFQSVVDATVSTRAVLDALYVHLPANGSELVLFDINRASRFGLLIAPGAETALERLLPAGPRAYRTTIVTNAGTEGDAVVERTTAAGQSAEEQRPLGLDYPRTVFSLSHVALPFPVTDGLYGLMPDPADDFGLQLGALALRGERGVLTVSLETLGRMSSNPFYPFMAARIGAAIPGPPPR